MHQPGYAELEYATGAPPPSPSCAAMAGGWAMGTPEVTDAPPRRGSRGVWWGLGAIDMASISDASWGEEGGEKGGCEGKKKRGGEKGW